jgi:hypothetical protein
MVIRSVPVSKLPQLTLETKKDMKEHGILGTIVGHVGDVSRIYLAAQIFTNDYAYRETSTRFFCLETTKSSRG